MNNRIYRFGWRPVLFMGGDRELVLMTALCSGMIMFYSFDLRLFIIAFILFMVSLKAFRMMAKADPLMKNVYLRHTKYKGVYLAKSTPFVVSHKIYK